MMLMMLARLCWKSSRQEGFGIRTELGELMLMMMLVVVDIFQWMGKRRTVLRKHEGPGRRTESSVLMMLIMLMMIARLCWKSSNA